MNSQNNSMVRMERNPWNFLVWGVTIISGKYKETNKKIPPKPQSLTCYKNLQTACHLVVLSSTDMSSDQKSSLLKFIKKLRNEVTANLPRSRKTAALNSRICKNLPLLDASTSIEVPSKNSPKQPRATGSPQAWPLTI